MSHDSTQYWTADEQDPVRQQCLTYATRISDLRSREYPQLNGTIYLDHAGTTLPSKSLVDNFSATILSELLCNTHSASSLQYRSSSQRVDEVRLQALQFVKASPDHFDLVFVANATAGIKLVGECLKDAGTEIGVQYGYHRDAHTSLVGLREVLGAATAAVCLESDQHVHDWLKLHEGVRSECGALAWEINPIALLAYPAQSNMDGRKLPLSWLSKARHAGVFSLLDAAALVSTSQLDLSDPTIAPDFTVMSFYKIFGFPDLGALIIRKDAGQLLKKKRYFGGGTVEMVVSIKEQWHVSKNASLHERLEDGTLPIHSIVALGCALKAHRGLFDSMDSVSRHTSFLANDLYLKLSDLRHYNYRSVCQFYGDRSSGAFGPIIAFNIKDSRGKWLSNYEVEKLASVKNIQLRIGGVCNPGGIASYLDLSPWEMLDNFGSGQRCGGKDDIQAGRPTGVIRVSLGAMSTLDDVLAFVAFMEEFFVETTLPETSANGTTPSITGFYVESLAIYPIKSCAGWFVPPETPWVVRPQGMAWDREWCIVHQGTRTSLSQKAYPKMALIRPNLDTVSGLLRIHYNGSLPLDVPQEITVPLSMRPDAFVTERSLDKSIVCGDHVSMRIYTSNTVTQFFSKILDTPCFLARLPPSGPDRSTRYTKPRLQGVHNQLQPLLLSNESPILVVSRSSLNRVNEIVKSKSPPGMAASANVFRANIVLAEDSCGFEQPFVEELWSSIEIASPSTGTIESKVTDHGDKSLRINLLGPCRRCQMVCINQCTGEKSADGEPFATLAKIKKRDGKVWFGMHAALSDTQAGTLQVGQLVKPWQ